MDYAIKRRRSSFAAARTSGAMSSFPKAVSTRSLIAAAWLSDAMFVQGGFDWASLLHAALFDSIQVTDHSGQDQGTADVSQ